MVSTKKIVVSLVITGASIGLLTNPSFAMSLVRAPRPSFSAAAKISADTETSPSSAAAQTTTSAAAAEPAVGPAPEPRPEPTTAHPRPTEPATTAAPTPGGGTAGGTVHVDAGAVEPTTTVKRDDRTPATLQLSCHMVPRPTRPSVACSWSGETPAGADNLKVLRSDGQVGRVRLSTGDTSLRAWTDDDAGSGKHFNYVIVFMNGDSGPTIAHTNAVTIDTPAATPPATEAPRPSTTAPHGEPATTKPHPEPTTTAPHNEPITTTPHGEPTTTAASSTVAVGVTTSASSNG